MQVVDIVAIRTSGADRMSSALRHPVRRCSTVWSARTSCNQFTFARCNQLRSPVPSDGQWLLGLALLIRRLGQIDRSFMKRQGADGVSEACLSLDVLRPVRIPGSVDDAMPVMVWVYGGNFLSTLAPGGIADSRALTSVVM